jgi:cell division transport system permease protein
MRPSRHLAFALSSAWQSFWRNAAVSMAAVISITLILALAGVNLVLGHALQGVLAIYEQRVAVMNISVQDDVPLPTVQEFMTRLQQDPRVQSVTFISKDEAFHRFAADPANRDIVSQVEGNPLSAKIQVRVSSLADLGAIDKVARGWPGADPTDPTDYKGDFIARVQKLASWLLYGGFGVLAILSVVSVVIVTNTIRTAVYHRRKEIEVMKLVGATEWFVRWPFLLEGMLTGLLGACVAIALLLVGYRPVVQHLSTQLFFIPLSYDPKFVNVLATEVLIGGALLGFLGSFIGVRRYVRI